MVHLNDPNQLVPNSRVLYLRTDRTQSEQQYRVGIIQSFDAHRVQLIDFESTDDYEAQWQLIYLLIAMNHDQPTRPFAKGTKLKPKDLCLAVNFDDFRHKFAVATYREAIFVKRQHSKVLIRVDDEEISIPTRVRIKDDIFSSVCQKVPALGSSALIMAITRSITDAMTAYQRKNDGYGHWKYCNDANKQEIPFARVKKYMHAGGRLTPYQFVYYKVDSGVLPALTVTNRATDLHLDVNYELGGSAVFDGYSQQLNEHNLPIL